ncbi:MAG: type I secretion system permease/ATPase [Variibacter sp.]|nr:type I secretion system permease/ATPase [Variibacter sp.]
MNWFATGKGAAARTEADELRAAVRECWLVAPHLLVLASFTNLLLVVPALFVMQLYDRVISSGRVETLVMLFMMATLAAVFMGFFDALRQVLLNRASRWLEKRLTPTLIGGSVRASVLGLPPTNQALQDLTTLRAAIGGSLIIAFTDLVWAPLFIAVVWLLHPLFGIIGLTAVALSLLLMLAAGLAQRAARDANQIVTANLGRAETAVRNADVFEAHGMLPAFIAQWNARNDPVAAAQTKAGMYNAILFGASRFVRVFVQLLIMAIGAYLVIEREIAPGALMAGSMLLYRALGPVEQSLASWRQFSAAREAYQRLRGILSLVPRPESSMPLPRPSGHIVCENVSFLVPNRSEPILNAVGFRLRPGEVLGIFGPSASGKSTLCRLLVGIARPTRGHVRLDGADVFAWDSTQLGPWIGYLPQDVELFEGTVRSNIARFDPAATANDVIEAAKAVGVHELINRLPQGYETEVGVRGSRLSGGQRQRIALARAFYRRPSVIVLDEPHANLDGEGEMSLVSAIVTGKSWGATVVLVAHQPHIMKPADKLLLLRNGRVEMFGERENVLRNLRSVTAGRRVGAQLKALSNTLPAAVEPLARR